MNSQSLATSTVSRQYQDNFRPLLTVSLSTELLEIYGPNVTTTEGKTFRFHLRIVAPPFADGSGANDLVWEETRLQTRRLMKSWHQGQSSSSTQQDINGLTLAVIAKAGFGQEPTWTTNLDGMVKSITPGHTISFLEAMTSTMVHMIPALLLPRWVMYNSPLRKAAIAHSEFEKYVREMIREEKRKISESKSYESTSARGNLLTSVLRASADMAAEVAKPDDLPSRKQAFTEDEVMGNLFLYLLAGYETTANSILYGLICLALYPDVQEKVIAEVDQVYAEAAKQGRTELTYADDFDKFKYTYGFMVRTPLPPFPSRSNSTYYRSSIIKLRISYLVRNPPPLPSTPANHQNGCPAHNHHRFHTPRPSSTISPPRRMPRLPQRPRNPPHRTLLAGPI